MNKDWFAVGLSFGIAAALAWMIGAEARRRGEKKFIKEKVQKWEDEGGRIPGATVSAETTTELP